MCKKHKCSFFVLSRTKKESSFWTNCPEAQIEKKTTLDIYAEVSDARKQESLLKLNNTGMLI